MSVRGVLGALDWAYLVSEWMAASPMSVVSQDYSGQLASTLAFPQQTARPIEVLLLPLSTQPESFQLKQFLFLLLLLLLPWAYPELVNYGQIGRAHV